MDFSDGALGSEDKLIDLFSETFAISEGSDEGALIDQLVRRLLCDTPARDIRVFTARHEGELVGGAIFSRLEYSEDPRSVFLLSPMAVAPYRQGQGVGQALINHALALLRDEGVAAVITYGDPAFYGKVGFQPLPEKDAAAPMPLGLPFGWIGQSLTEEPLGKLKGKCTCVDALKDPIYW